MKKVIINEGLCKGCGLCVEVCPKKILVISSETINDKGYNPAYMAQENEALCISCAMCAKMCPDCVISVYKEEK